MLPVGWLPPRGSSPLARGLPSRSGGARPGPRIIPARAGFTSWPTRRATPSTDHPRSRGVYQTGAARISRRLWIIPARAGFTGAPVRLPAPRADHPRSRGVYPEPLDDGVQREGSSPLARGLLGVGIVLLKPVRIIPARAGFTRRQRRRHPTRRDHPRSRGVYLTRNELIKMLNGSSPLARGLRDIFTRAIVKTGIIPARAGFTGRAGAPRRPERDHPRSRGVYETAMPVAVAPAGSSPLARGLLTAACPPAGMLRIIPARAGFTPPARSRMRGRADHPRSRGVYEYPGHQWPSRGGSSPLARGLPVASPCDGGLERIIPARAGFTTCSPRPCRSSRDHPRSRGVYQTIAAAIIRRLGSSPLARGLPRGAGHSVRHARIIPARAGFTRGAGPR